MELLDFKMEVTVSEPCDVIRVGKHDQIKKIWRCSFPENEGDFHHLILEIASAIPILNE